MFIIDQNFSLDPSIAWDQVPEVEFRLGLDISRADPWSALDLFLHNAVSVKHLTIVNDINYPVNIMHHLNLFKSMGWTNTLVLEIQNILCASLATVESDAATLQLTFNHLDFASIDYHMIVSANLAAHVCLRKEHQWQPVKITRYRPSQLTQRIDLADLDAGYSDRNLDCGSFKNPNVDIDAGIIVV